MRDCGAVIRNGVSRTCPDGRNRKIFEFFSENRGQFSICLAVTPIESSFAKAGKISFFSGKDAFFTEHLPKNFEYTVWTVVRHGEFRSGTFFVFFGEKGGFLLSVCRKNLNKGDDGLSAFIGGCQCRAPVGTGDFRKILKFFLKTGAKTYPCLAITPLERCFVGSGKTTFFKEKSEKP